MWKFRRYGYRAGALALAILPETAQESRVHVGRQAHLNVAKFVCCCGRDSAGPSECQSFLEPLVHRVGPVQPGKLLQPFQVISPRCGIASALANPSVLPRMGSRSPGLDVVVCQVLCWPSDHPLSQGSIVTASPGPNLDLTIFELKIRHSGVLDMDVPEFHRRGVFS